MKTLKIIFKGVKFDDYNISSDGVWSQICEKCADKHNSLPKEAFDNTGSGVCGVEGCSNTDENTDIEVFYIDFPIDLQKLKNSPKGSFYDESGLTPEHLNTENLIEEYVRIYGDEAILEFLKE